MIERPRLVLLHEEDTILVCVTPVSPGDLLEIDGAAVAAREWIDVGHKVARRALPEGDKVIKHGAPIGSVVRDVAAGEWVHVHNMKSDYLASHSREAVSERDG